MGRIPRSYHETVPAEAFAPGALASLPRVEPAAPDAPPEFERTGLAEQLRRLGYPAPPLRSRFELDGLLGAGANGRVYAARDHDLERLVAVKMLAEPRPSPEALARFVEEARITAALDHPNVLPVHDLEVNSRGQVFFTTKRIGGRALGAAIEESTAARRVAPLDDANAVVSVFIGVCQALALAHRQGIVHQDVKPDNIMLGDFGEVLLVDWGSAYRLNGAAEAQIYGTPLYMSPEQARREPPDRRSDVYCVGASIFHALTLRPPAWDDDDRRFWAMKAAGELQPPTAAERAAAPAPLLAIALRALAPRRDDRYPDAGALLDDLKRYQAGLAVSAWREPWWSRLRRWHRGNRRAFWSWSAAAAVMAALASALWVESRKEVANWGEPKLVQRFADESWRRDWLPYSGSFVIRDGRLVSTGPDLNVLVLNQRLRGAIAIEYEAEMLPGGHPCDISLVWARGIELAPDGRSVTKFDQVHALQVGAFDGAYTAITDGLDTATHLATDRFRPEPGRRYRVRVEVVDNRLTLAVDGRTRCEWEDAFPFAGGYAALEGYYPDKAFSDLRIYQREVPEKVPATAIGDATARAGQYALAADQYAEVAESRLGSELGREALWKEGLCWWRADRRDRAREVWEALRGTDRDDLVRTYDVEQRLADGDPRAALAEIDRQWDSAGTEARRRLAGLWSGAVLGLKQPEQKALIEAYVELHDRRFADLTVTDYAAAQALLGLQRYDEVLSRYSYQRWVCTEALSKSGRNDLIVRDYADQRAAYASACFSSGTFAGLDADPDAIRSMWIESLWMRDRAEEVLALRDVPASERWQALLALGRADEVVADPQSCGRERALALAALGRAAEAAASPDHETRANGLIALGDAAGMRAAEPSDEHYRAWTRCVDAIDALVAGDAVRARDGFRAPPRVEEIDARMWTALLAASSGIGSVDGDYTLLDRACAQGLGSRWNDSQRFWYDASYLTGRIDDHDYLAQPFKAWTRDRLVLMRAMRQDRLGNAGSALADYRVYTAFPLWRHGQYPDGAVERFVAWRIAKLSAR